MSTFLDTITIDDFKQKFARDFKYLPYWDILTNYFIGDKVYYSVNKKFYLALTDNIGIIPTTTTDWQIAQDNVLLYISNEELQSSLDEAKCLINIFLCFPSDCYLKNVFLLLMAHILYVKVNSGGLQGDNGLIETSRSVGSVSQGFTVPSYMLKDSFWLYYQKSPYGVDYANFLSPCLTLSSIRRADPKTR